MCGSSGSEISPLNSIAHRSEYFAANSMSWLTIIIVLPLISSSSDILPAYFYKIHPFLLSARREGVSEGC